MQLALRRVLSGGRVWFAAAFLTALVWLPTSDAQAQFRNNAFEMEIGHYGFGWTTDWLNTLVLGPTNEWGMGDQPVIGIKYIRVVGTIPFTPWDDLWAWYPALITFGGGLASPDGAVAATGLRFVGTVSSGIGAKYWFLDEKYRPYVRGEVLAFITGPVDGTTIAPIAAGIGGYGGARIAVGYEHFVLPEISVSIETSVLGLFTILAPPKVSHSTRLGVGVYF